MVMQPEDIRAMVDAPEVADNLMQRASIRRFEERPVETEKIEAFVRAGQQAPFTGQMYSVIVTTERARREELAGIFGPLVTGAPVFALVCVDFRRLEKFIAARGRTNRTDDLSMLFLGIQDAAYMGQNMVLAAEALGLGSCFLGAAPFAADQLREMFFMPSRVYPLVGLVLGYPAERPGPRPRIPLECVLHWDTYQDLTDEGVERALDVMDAGLIREGYYRRLNAKIPLDEEGKDELPADDDYGWGEHVSRKYSLLRLSGIRDMLSRSGIDTSGSGEVQG